MDLVSVVVPIYNVEPYLQECIDSIASQTFQNLQIVLVDDGSPDNCGVICDAAAEKDDRIVVLHCENGGLSVARNRGMEVCRGKYILFVDSDDYLNRNAISVLYDTAEREALDIVLYDAISFDETNIQTSPESEITKYIRKNPYDAVYRGAQLFMEMVENDDYRSPVQYCFYRKSFLDHHLLAFHKGILHEDEEFNFLALLYSERVKHISEVLYHHRFRADSIMSTKISKRNTDSLYAIINTVMDKRDDFLPDDKTEQAYKLGVARFIQNYFNCVKLSKDRELPELKDQIRSLKKVLKRANYLSDRAVRDAVRYGLRKPITVKAIKIKLYPYVKFLLGRR